MEPKGVEGRTGRGGQRRGSRSLPVRSRSRRSSVRSNRTIGPAILCVSSSIWPGVRARGLKSTGVYAGRASSSAECEAGGSFAEYAGGGPLGGGGGGGGGLAEYGGGDVELMSRWTWGAGAGAGAGGSGEAAEERCTGRAMGGAAWVVVSGTARGVGVPALVLVGAGVLPVALSAGCAGCAGFIGFIGFAVLVRWTGTGASPCRVAVVRCVGRAGAARCTVGRATGVLVGVGSPPGGGTAGVPAAAECRTTGVACAAGPGIATGSPPAGAAEPSAVRRCTTGAPPVTVPEDAAPCDCGPPTAAASGRGDVTEAAARCTTGAWPVGVERCTVGVSPVGIAGTFAGPGVPGTRAEVAPGSWERGTGGLPLGVLGPAATRCTTGAPSPSRRGGTAAGRPVRLCGVGTAGTGVAALGGSAVGRSSGAAGAVPDGTEGAACCPCVAGLPPGAGELSSTRRCTGGVAPAGRSGEGLLVRCV